MNAAKNLALVHIGPAVAVRDSQTMKEAATKQDLYNMGVQIDSIFGKVISQLTIVKSELVINDRINCMNFRFFSRITPAGMHIKLFILAIDDDKEELYEVTLVDGELVETSELMKSMVDGFQNMEEISQEDAMQIYEDGGAAEAMKRRFE